MIFYMELDEVVKLIELENRFNSECKRVCKELKAYKRDYKYMDSFYIESNNDNYTIHCTGVYHKDNEYIEVKGYFPADCLSMEPLNLRLYVEDRIISKVETELYETHNIERGKEKAEYDLYLKLKEKYDIEDETVENIE